MTDWSTLKKLIWLRIIKGGGSALRTVTGALIHVTNALALPAEALTVNVEPIQDLHGYDSPWPAGGGINLVDKVSNESYGGTVSADGLTVTSKVVTASGNSNFMRAMFSQPFDVVTSEQLYISFDVRLLAGTMDSFGVQLVGGSNSTNMGIIKYGNVPSTAKQRISLFGLPNRDDLARGIYIQAQNADGAQLEISTIQISKVEDYNYHPYSNICPISGRTSATVTRCGKNLLSRANEDLPKTASGVTFSRSGSDYIVSATDDKDSYPYAKIGELNGLKAGNYTLSYSAGVIGVTLRIIDRTVSPVQTIATATTSSSYVRAFTLSESNTHTLSVEIAVTGSAIAVGNYTIHPMLELGSNASAYEPYAGNTYTIQLGDTVYGGTLDVTGGKLTVQWGIVDLGTLNWLTSPQKFFYTMLSGKKPGATNLICTNYKTKMRSLWDADELAISGNVNTGQLYIRDMSLQGETGAEFKSDMSGVQLCYELATPLEITLTPTQIEMLLGENNLWSDAGDSTLTYYAEGEASTSEALGILLGGTYNNPGSADDVSDDEALGILLGGS